jgi:hypothetical protein
MKFFFFSGWSAESIGYNTGDGKLYKGKGSFLQENKYQGGGTSYHGGGGEGGAIFLFMLRIRANMAHMFTLIPIT